MRISKLAAVCVTAAALACSGKALDAIAARIASLAFSTPTATLRLGGSTKLSVTARDQSGNVVSGPQLSWQSSNTAVASVSDSGVVRALSLGMAAVTASAESQTATVQVVVSAVPLASIGVTLSRTTIPVGQTATATASLKDSTGATVTGKPVAWSSSNTSVASVDGGGVVSALAPGTSTISAAADGVTGSSAMTVIVAPVASVVLSPASASLITGGTFQFTATTFDATGLPLTGRVVTWVSSNAAVASVSASGLVTAAGVGSATITATSEGITGTSTVTVAAPPPIPVASVAVALNASTLTVGQSTQATATTRDGSGNVLTGRGITWSSSNVAVATVSSSGVVQAVGAGTASIQATSEGVTGSATLTVSIVPVASVTVTLGSSSVAAGQSTQATATLKDASGSVLTGRTITWSSSATGIATVSSSGLVLGVAPGTASIQATSGGVTGSATVTVTQVPVATVTVSLGASSITAGSTTQASAVTKDASGNTLTGRVITWASSASGVATVNASGVVTGVAAGTATITATSEGKSGTATVTVTAAAPAPVATVTLAPTNMNLTVGRSSQLTATMKDAAGNTLTGRVVTWATSASGVATVSTSGLVTAVAVGTATITATSEGKSATASVTVSTLVTPGPDVPVYDPTNPNHVLHAFEDWSAYASPSQIATTNRADGGGPWLDGSAAFQTLTTTNVDPWFGKKTLDIDLRATPAQGQSVAHGVVLTQGTPARYLNASSVKESIVIEWAWRFTGTSYQGKIADWQPAPGTDRFNYQAPGYDQLGNQMNNTCDNDPLCSLYYSNRGNTPRFAGLMPTSTDVGAAFARGIYATNVVFYIQNRNWGTGPGQVSWGSDGQAMADDTWRRTILRFTLNQNGTMGYGRLEEWLEKAGSAPVKVMEYIGDIGGFDQGLVKGRDITQGGNTWLTTTSELHLYDLTSIGGIYMGGNTTHLGYVRIWSMPRQ